MNVAPQESRRTMVSTGSYDDSRNKKLDRAPYPFTQQIDLVLPSDTELEDQLKAVTATYWSCRTTLSAFLKYAKSLVNRFELESDIAAISVFDASTEEVLCLDPRGVLSLVVQKTTYERLGLVGQRMRWAGCDDMHVIQMTLLESVPNHTATRKWHLYGPKHEAVFEKWDAERGPWHILYYLRGQGPNSLALEGSIEHTVTPILYKTDNVNVPEPVLRVYPTDEEGREDWDEEVSALFEWAGMACLGAQRLRVNDRCDPYVAVYTSPTPSRVACVTHMLWHGLLPPAFVQDVIDRVMAPLTHPLFASITVHGVPTTPVAYISPASPLQTPMRAPRPESEDTWSLLVSSHGDVMSEAQTPVSACRWVLAESVGKWDARWG